MSARNKPAAKKQRRAEREAKDKRRLAEQAAAVVIPLRRMWGHYL